MVRSVEPSIETIDQGRTGHQPENCRGAWRLSTDFRTRARRQSRRMRQRELTPCSTVQSIAEARATAVKWPVRGVSRGSPGGATALAALLSGRYKPATDERIAVLLCGASTPAVDFNRH